MFEPQERLRGGCNHFDVAGDLVTGMHSGRQTCFLSGTAYLTYLCCIVVEMTGGGYDSWTIYG